MGCACVRLLPDNFVCSVKLSFLLLQSHFGDEVFLKSVFFCSIKSFISQLRFHLLHHFLCPEYEDTKVIQLILFSL